MHSWIFRYRARLRFLYGMSPTEPAPALPGARDEDGCEADMLYIEDGCSEAPEVHGRVLRRQRYVLIEPSRTRRRRG